MIPGFPNLYNPLSIHLLYQKCFKTYKTNYGNILEQYVFVNMGIIVDLFWKSMYRFSSYLNFGYLLLDGHREMTKVPANKSSKPWMWISYLSKAWNGNLVTCVCASKYWINLWNPEIHKTYVTRIKSIERIPSTPQHSDSHPCTRPRFSRSLSRWYFA